MFIHWTATGRSTATRWVQLSLTMSIGWGEACHMANPVPGTIETKAPPDAPDRGAPLAAVHSRPRCDFHAFADESRARGSNRRDTISSTRHWRPSVRGRQDDSEEGIIHG